MDDNIGEYIELQPTIHKEAFSVGDLLQMEFEGSSRTRRYYGIIVNIGTFELEVMLCNSKGMNHGLSDRRILSAKSIYNKDVKIKIIKLD